jgi:hypothetical protein
MTCRSQRMMKMRSSSRSLRGGLCRDEGRILTGAGEPQWIRPGYRIVNVVAEGCRRDVEPVRRLAVAR